MVLATNLEQIRHMLVIWGRERSVGKAWAATARGDRPDTSQLPALYFTYVLGSGGHTGELCEIIKQQFKAGRNLHRRYITSGDTHSHNALLQLEDLIQRAYPDGSAGTWDVFKVMRARRVHQPIYTAWYTSILSAISIVRALVQEPKNRPKSIYGNAFKYPHVVVSNGPGTGFIVYLVAHLLKMFFLIPKDRVRTVYIETWAHITTLSLTGKLFYYTDIADVFMVQHRALATKIRKPFVGEVAKAGNLLGIKE